MQRLAAPLLHPLLQEYRRPLNHSQHHQHLIHTFFQFLLEYKNSEKLLDYEDTEQLIAGEKQRSKATSGIYSCSKRDYFNQVTTSCFQREKTAFTSIFWVLVWTQRWGSIYMKNERKQIFLHVSIFCHRLNIMRDMHINLV